MGQGGIIKGWGLSDGVIVTGGSADVADKHPAVCSWRTPKGLCMAPTEWLPTALGVQAALCMKHVAAQMREEVKGGFADATARDYNKLG